MARLTPQRGAWARVGAQLLSATCGLLLALEVSGQSSALTRAALVAAIVVAATWLTFALARRPHEHSTAAAGTLAAMMALEQQEADRLAGRLHRTAIQSLLVAGILAAMEHMAAQAPAIPWLASAPTDCPLLPADFVERLRQRQQETQAELVIAASGGREHPVCALWSCGLLPALRETVAAGEARVLAFVRSRPHAIVAWPTTPFDPFFNVNTPADLACLDASA